MNNIKRDDNFIFSFPLIDIAQGAMFMFPLLLIGYIYSNPNFSIALSFLYPLVSAGWIITLGNGRISMNITECKNTTDISAMKYKHFIVVTSAENSILSSVDFWFQIGGYLLIIFGIILSSFMLLLQHLYEIESNWMSFDNIYTSIIIIYMISICFLGTILRIYFLVRDYVWYKKNHK